MRNVAWSLVATFVCLVAGCAPQPKVPCPEEKAFAAAVSQMCDVDRQAGLSADADPIGVGAKRTAWIAEHVDNPDAIELRVYLGVKGAGDQAVMLRDKARELGVRSCALADSLARTGEGGISP
jgi:hypothetical protein